LNGKILGIIVFVIVICASIASFVTLSLEAPAQHTPQPLDFTVSGTNTCLRILESNVSLCYIPFTVGANQNWQLSINCTQMPGGANGWTDLFIYNGYWSNETDYKCEAKDLYPILTDIKTADGAIQGNSTFTETFNSTTQQSHTVFFVFPNGGQATFHVTYKQVQ
jgi:hypothetical protein